MKSLTTYITCLLAVILMNTTINTAKAQTPYFWEATNGPSGGNMGILVLDSLGNLYATGGGSIFSSSDKGKNWSNIYKYNNIDFTCLAVSPHGRIWTGTLWQGIICSVHPIDGGAWKQVGLFNYQVVALAVDSNGVVYAATRDNGVWKLVYYGSNAVWEIISDLNGYTIKTMSGYYEYDGDYILVVATNAGWIFQYHTLDKYRITLNKAGLTNIDIQTIANRGYTIGTMGGVFQYNGSGWYQVGGSDKFNYPISSLSYLSNYLIAGTYGNGLFRYRVSWEKADSGLEGNSISQIVRVSDSEVVASTNCGVFNSTNIDSYSGDVYWNSINGNLVLTQNYIVNYSPRGYILTANERGIFRTTDHGNDWIKILGSNGSRLSNIKINNQGHIFVGSCYGALRSTDDGNSWECIDNDLLYKLTNFTFTNSGSILAIGYINKIYRSIDNCKSWQEINDSSFTKPLYISDINSTSNGSLCLVSYYGDVYRSTDDGITWTQTASNLSGSSLSTNIVNAPNGNLFLGSPLYIYRSIDDGITWTQRNEIDPYSNSYNIAINSLGNIFAAKRAGVGYSTDEGETWIHTSLPEWYISALSLTITDDGYVYIGTNGVGVYKSVKSTTTAVTDIADLPTAFRLTSNYPNPFNPSTNIEYRIMNHEYVSLKVFNILGQEVATLVNEMKTPGKYTVKWNAENNPSGMYFYRLQTSTYCETKKMVILK